ncbi:MAG: BON domain-containing protein [Rhodocyclaceae bacterium]|jgi:osmotically-inducible protein OsmY|nr:BON domain-containing protein [Rhodocyclaceae bacterium]
MRNYTSRLTTCLSLLAMAATLAGCVGAVAVGAGSGALMVTDRRVSEVYLADEGIEIRVGNAIRQQLGDKVHVNVTSYNRMLLLTGEAPDAATRDLVERTAIANSTEIKRITNELQIAGNSSFATRSNDTYLTSKVKARFLDAARFSINHVKVVTENSSVYLLGLVTQAEADAAVEIARTTGGVQRVIRVFEIISDDQARQIDRKSQASSGSK